MPVKAPPIYQNTESPDEGRIAAVLSLYYQAAALAGIKVHLSSFTDFEQLVRKHINAGGEAQRVALTGWLFKFLSEVLLFAADQQRDYLGEDGVAHAQEMTCRVFPFCEADE